MLRRMSRTLFGRRRADRGVDRGEGDHDDHGPACDVRPGSRRSVAGRPRIRIPGRRGRAASRSPPRRACRRWRRAGSFSPQRGGLKPHAPGIGAPGLAGGDPAPPCVAITSSLCRERFGRPFRTGGATPAPPGHRTLRRDAAPLAPVGAAVGCASVAVLAACTLSSARPGRPISRRRFRTVSGAPGLKTVEPIGRQGGPENYH